MKNRKPMIGVIPLFDDEKDSVWMLPGYLDGIRLAGGIPLVLPLCCGGADLQQVDAVCDGYLFTGGHDVDPRLYGEEKSALCGPLNPDRDELERQIFHLAWEQDKPVLGICRGLQMINVLMGGTLYQDLPAQYTGVGAAETEGQGPVRVLHHMEPPYDRPCHSVNLAPDAPLARLLGRECLDVNSYHHQGIRRLADGLAAMATAKDGLVEAVWAPGRTYVQAVQWHPEFMYRKYPEALKIFASFVGSCRG